MPRPEGMRKSVRAPQQHRTAAPQHAARSTQYGARLVSTDGAPAASALPAESQRGHLGVCGGRCPRRAGWAGEVRCQITASTTPAEPQARRFPDRLF